MMNPIVYILYQLISLYSMVIFIWVVVGLLIYFKIVNAYQPVVQKVMRVLNRLIEPALRPIRRALPYIEGIDLSPLVLILILQFLSYTLVYYF